MEVTDINTMFAFCRSIFYFLYLSVTRKLHISSELTFHTILKSYGQRTMRNSQLTLNIPWEVTHFLKLNSLTVLSPFSIVCQNEYNKKFNFRKLKECFVSF